MVGGKGEEDLTPRALRIAAVIGIAAAAALAAGSATATHKIAHGTPAGPAPASFGAGFAPPKDSEWGWDLGGFGGETKGKALAFNPVIFVHGNSVDASFWDVAAESPPTIVNVRNAFKAAGYDDQEVWALSYNGQGCSNTALCGTINDVNVPDMYSFIRAVRDYTGAAKVDVVSHSLGVTVVRKTVKDHPELLGEMEDFVGIAGANHGTTSCRGIEDTWYGCDEVAPGTAWLADLNSWDPRGEGDETPGPARYMTIYDGSGVADTFFFGEDAQSPRLSGADNREMPFTAHNTLARGQGAIDVYLPFVKGHNEVRRTDSGPVTTPSQREAARRRALAATGGPELRSLGWLLVVAGALARRRLRVC